MSAPMPSMVLLVDFTPALLRRLLRVNPATRTRKKCRARSDEADKAPTIERRISNRLLLQHWNQQGIAYRTVPNQD
jgi:hypothetical protein